MSNDETESCWRCARVIHDGQVPVLARIDGRCRSVCSGCVRTGQLREVGAAVPEPPPLPARGPSVHDLVVADLIARKVMGLQKYGTALQAGNGRDALMDAYQECLDMAAYLRQAIAERDEEKR